MSIYLIRHGQTDGNARRVVQHPETPLSARGRSQADSLARRLAGEAIVSLLSSDYARAAGTAEAIRVVTGAPLVHEPLLRERNFGDLRGTSYDELEARGIEPFAEDYAPPGGESWEAFHARVDAAWEAVARAAAELDGHLAVVTHGLVCHSLLRRKLEQSLDPNAAVAFPNTSLSILEGPPWRAWLVGCVAHLELEGGVEEGGAA